jgi:hypothetical protein
VAKLGSDGLLLHTRSSTPRMGKIPHRTSKMRTGATHEQGRLPRTRTEIGLCPLLHEEKSAERKLGRRTETGLRAGGGEKQNQDDTMMACTPDTQERLKQEQTKSKREQGFTQTGELLRTSESKEEEQIVHTRSKKSGFFIENEWRSPSSLAHLIGN